MAGSQDDIPPPPPPPSQTPTQQTPHNVSSIKLPILKKGEYDIWAMKMEYYLTHTDYPIWEVIQTGNGPVSITTDTQGVYIEDANQKFLRSLPSSWSQVSLIMRTKPGVDSLSFDDLYKNLRVFENDVKGSTASIPLACRICPQLDHEDLEQLDEFDLEEMDLKWQVAMISMRMKKFYKKTGRKLQFDAKEPVGFDKTKVECYNCHKTGHFARECRTKGNQDSKSIDAWNSRNKDGRRSSKQEDSKALVTIDGEGVDWTSHSEEEEDFALMACNSSGSDREIKAYTQALKKVEAQLVAHQQGQLWYEEKIRFMKIDLDDKTDVLTYHKKLLAEAEKEKEDLKAKVEKWHNSSKNLSLLQNSQMSANDKFGLGYGDHRYDGILSYENEVLQSVFMNKESDLENQPLYNRTAEEILARERERKARTTLLMALPEDHLAKFHKMTDAKEMWEAIKSRCGGNDESKKMQKYILKQQFEGVSSEDANQKFLRSLPSAWSQVSLIMRTKPGVDSLSFDDLYNNLRVFKNDVKGSTGSSSSTQNATFVYENTSSTNDVSTAYGVSNPSGQNSQYEHASSYSLLANQSSYPQLDHEDLE
ncbi:ribonuclease H-like domain-containing protein [Tanacetum coccineum]